MERFREYLNYEFGRTYIMLPVECRYDGRLCSPTKVGYSILVENEIIPLKIIGT